ncbi:MAG: hypothetical protein Q4D29_05775 [Lachnospiraceae bacterium]|nr:hypothetical protein [Lachnospiraceae bacterium]
MKEPLLSYDNAKTGLKITLPILIALLSIFVLSRIVSSDLYTKSLIEVVDANRDSVLKLTASSTSVSVAISALPGDLATPIAEKLADLSIGFMIVLSAIYIEKFIIMITGLVVFKWLIPVACILYLIGDVFKGRERLKEIAYKFVVLSIAIVVVMPASVSVTKLIRNVYGTTIDETIKSAESSSELIKESMGTKDNEEDTTKGLSEVIKSLKDSGDSIAAGTSEFMRYLEKLFTRYVDAVAILAVTSCIIPILVIVVIWYMIKLIFLPDFSIRAQKLP